jgi:hypothetical protein
MFKWKNARHISGWLDIYRDIRSYIWLFVGKSFIWSDIWAYVTIWKQPFRYMSWQFDIVSKKIPIYDRLSRYISNHPDICRDNLTIFFKKTRYMNDIHDIYPTWQIYVVYVINIAYQFVIFRQNDGLYIGMVGHISCQADIYRDNRDIYRVFVSCVYVRYINRLFLSNWNFGCAYKRFSDMCLTIWQLIWMAWHDMWAVILK